MSNLEKDHGKNKVRAPWFKFFSTDWLEGTRTLSAAHRGIYADCLALMYQIDGPLPADEKWMAHALHESIRSWRSARLALLRAGKLTFLQDGWSNSRADEERFKRRSTADQNALIARSREDQKREKSKKGNENNETTPRSVARNEHHTYARQTSESDSERKSSAVSAAPLKMDFETVEKRLIPAANGALDNPVNCQGLLCTSVPQMWLDRGYDLERDILPSLEAAGRKHHGKRIKSWSYFTDIIADAAAKRQKSMPAAPSPPGEYKLPDHLQALIAEAKAAGYAS